MSDVDAKGKQPNYTEAEEARIVELYEEFGNSKEGVEMIRVSMETEFDKTRSTRSVIAKLGQLGVWEKRPVVKAEKVDRGPTKKDLMRTLESVAGEGFSAKGLEGATKEAISNVIDLVTKAS